MSVLEQLQALWDDLPEMACKGKCQNCCGPIDMSPAERELLRERKVEILPLTPMRSAMWEQNAKFDLLGRPLWCSALSLETGKCTVYEVRPTVCRLWGAAESMACPHGCKPTRMLTDHEAMAYLTESMVIGGGITAEQREEMLRIFSDPEITEGVGKLMRGDGGDKAELYRKIEERRNPS